MASSKECDFLSKVVSGRVGREYEVIEGGGEAREKLVVYMVGDDHVQGVTLL